MEQHFHQLTKEDRHTIAVLKKRKLTHKEIAAEIGFSERTIRRELKRGRRSGRAYNATDAHQKKLSRRKRSKYLGMKIDKHPELESFITSALKARQRPETIAGRIKVFHGQASHNPLPPVTAKSIYNWLYAPQGAKYAHLLPSKRYQPKQRKKPTAKREIIPNRVSISRRPLSANNRSRYGHTASDTMVSGKKTGSKAAIAGTLERKLRYVSLSKLKDLKPATMNAGLKSNFNAMGIAIHTDTKDNGIENAYHEQIERELGISSYFCDPYSSWQKGEIENIFKLVRAEGVPKGMDLNELSAKQLRAIQDTLNNRWRKSLGYYSPAELMEKRRRYEERQKQKLQLTNTLSYTGSKSLKTTKEKAAT